MNTFTSNNKHFSKVKEKKERLFHQSTFFFLAFKMQNLRDYYALLKTFQNPPPPFF